MKNEQLSLWKLKIDMEHNSIEELFCKSIAITALFFMCLLPPETLAQDISGQETLFSVDSSEQQVVKYTADFFGRYQPATALDMVRQVPGFQLNDGESARGFGNSVGNILINGRYPSVKRDLPSAILARIPAGQVAVIELIRGQVRGIDLQSQAVVANILLVENAPAAIRWQASVLHSSTGPLRPGLNVSLADRLKDIEYNIGIHIERNTNGEHGPEKVFDGNGELVEERYDYEQETGFILTGLTFSASTWLGESLFNANGKFAFRHGPEVLNSSRTPVLPDSLSREVFIKLNQYLPSYELSIDAERNLYRDLNGKFILMAIGNEQDLLESQYIVDSERTQTLLRIADTNTKAIEGIGRMELDWSGWENHTVQLNLEGAYNRLDGSFIQTVDTGAGSVVVDVPGANSLVEEIRGDFLLKDTWSLGQFELGYGLGGEVSTISQSGDEELERSFFFLKPQGVISYASGEGMQTRLRLAREVAQLNFNDFISATVFEDDDLALGNPNLRPDKTWVAELIHERRFGRLSVIKVTAFHHWISDVLDLLPLTSTFAVPGNIGDGRRWGMELESTVPLDWMNLSGARLNVKARWQDSRVVDPVTGLYRSLSSRGGFRGSPLITFRNGNKYVFDVAYRQDFQAARVAWGWGIAEQAERPLYKVNELDLYNEGIGLSAFIETTRWWGLKTRIEGYNLLNWTETRSRVIYAGQRDLSPVATRIERQRYAGRRITLVLSGNF